MIAFIFDKGAQSIAILLLAKVLGAADYGRLTLAQGMVNAVQIFVVLGAGTIIARYIPALLKISFRRAVEVINLCFLVIFMTGVLFAISGILTAGEIAVSILDLPASSAIPYWVLLWTLLTALNGLFLTIMLSFENGRAAGIVSLASAVLMLIIIPISTDKYGFYGAVVGLTLTAAIRMTLFLSFYIQLLRSHGVALRVSPLRSDIPLLLSFGLPVFLSSAIWAPTMWLCQIVLKEFSPGGLASVGLFGFCNNILGLIILISSITNRASFPILSSLAAKGDGGEARKFATSILLVQVAAAVAVSVPVIIFAPHIMEMMGGQFAGGELVLIVMVISGLILAGQQPLVNLLLVHDKAFTNLVGMSIWSVVLLGCSLVFVPIGALGVALAVLSAATIKGLFITWRTMNISYDQNATS